MRGQAADYDGWRQLGLDRLGLGRRAALLPHATRTTSAPPNALPPRAAASGGSSIRASAGRSSTPSARRRPRPASRRSTTSTPATTRARPISRSTRSAAGAGARRGASCKPVLNRPNLRLETGVAGRARRLRGRARDRRRCSRRGGERRRGARRRRGDPGGRRRRLAEDPRAVGHRRRATRLAGARHRGRSTHLPGVGENLQDHLQLRPVYKVSGVRTLNTDYARLWRRAAMGAGIRCSCATGR